MSDPQDLDRILQPPVEILPPRPEDFDRTWHTASQLRRNRALLAATGAALLALLVAPVGFWIVSYDQRDTVATEQTPTPFTASPSEASPPTATAPSTSGNQASDPQCTAAELAVRLGPTGVAAGNNYATLVLTNTADQTCDLKGHPRVSALDANKQQLGPTASYATGNPGISVELSPDATASTVLHFASVEAGPCQPPSTYLRIYPPGSDDFITIRAEIVLCGESFDVRNLISGPDGVS